MIKMIGSEGFTIKDEGIVDGEYVRINHFLIEARNGNSEEYLYVNENQIHELIQLLQKVKDVM